MKNVKKNVMLGLGTATLMGAGLLVYNKVLSPKTKKKMCRLEDDICEDFENMI